MQINIINNYQENIQINSIQNDLVQVLLNIINNSADILKTKLNQKRYIIISSYKIKNQVVVEIQDSGGGIPINIINNIFEPYFTTKHKSQGTGLGLYMTHKIIVDNMKGDILVENSKFQYNDIEYFGAKFIITLPLS